MRRAMLLIFGNRATSARYRQMGPVVIPLIRHEWVLSPFHERGYPFSLFCGKIEWNHIGEVQMDTRSLANQLGLYLADLPEVKKWGLYGSLQAGTNDRFSDIDIIFDVFR